MRLWLQVPESQETIGSDDVVVDIGDPGPVSKRPRSSHARRGQQEQGEAMDVSDSPPGGHNVPIRQSSRLSQRAGARASADPEPVQPATLQLDVLRCSRCSQVHHNADRCRAKPAVTLPHISVPHLYRHPSSVCLKLGALPALQSSLNMCSPPRCKQEPPPDTQRQGRQRASTRQGSAPAEPAQSQRFYVKEPGGPGEPLNA